MYVLDAMNGWLYVKQTDTDYFEPKRYTWWWPTGYRYIDFERNFSTPELAHEALGKLLNPTSNCSYVDERGWTYRLTDGGQTKPEHTAVEPIPEPKQRGRKCELAWQDGQWWKYTAKGKVLA